jgi:hypothetical protein
MIKIRLFIKEIILIIFFIILVIIEGYLIQFNLLYIALFDGLIAFLLGLYLLRVIIKKIKLNLLNRH